MLDVDMLGLGECHIVGGEGDASHVIVLVGGGWASEGTSESRKKLTEEYDFLRGSS